MKVKSDITTKEVEVVKTELVIEKVITLTLSEREAKLLGCLIGAMSPTECETIVVERSMNFNTWIGSINGREMVELTGDIYDNIFNIFGYGYDE